MSKKRTLAITSTNHVINTPLILYSFVLLHLTDFSSLKQMRFVPSN